MSISDKQLAQIRRKQREFLEALLEITQLWTKTLDVDDVLEAGRKVGLEDILVSEFLIYWINKGEIDESYWHLVEEIRKGFERRGKAVTDQAAATRQCDVFISHASEDKDEIARPLYEALVARGVIVWFDESTLKLGDSLRRKIDEGLAGCRYGIVILSPRFLAKEWPQRELDGLVARETVSGEKAILPIWHKLGRDELSAYSPTLADKLGVQSSQGLQAVVDKVMEVFWP